MEYENLVLIDISLNRKNSFEKINAQKDNS